MTTPRRIRHLAAVLALACLAAPAVAQAPADPLAPFGWLRQLAGSCWRGEYANSRAGDKQCYEWQYGRFLRATSQAQTESPRRSSGVAPSPCTPVSSIVPRRKRPYCHS